MTTDDVCKPSAEVLRMRECWEKIDALIGGTYGMRKAGPSFMPLRPDEAQDAYSYRLKTTTLFNAFGRTINGLSAKPFEEPLEYTNIPAIIEKWFENVDLAGRNLDVFAKEWFKSALTYGVSYVLVDYPEVTDARTVADEKKIGARPYLVHISPHQILGWKSEKIQGVQTLTQVRIKECVEEDDGPFSVKSLEQVRVLYRDKWEVYRQSQDAQGRRTWMLYKTGKNSIQRIPLVAYYTGRVGFMTGRPPLEDLADLNVAHWVSNSYQTAILDTARVPILFMTGFQKTPDEGHPKISVGAGAAMFADHPDAKLTYVEHSGAAIESGRQSLQDIEEQMRLLGAELLVKKPGSMTATQASLDTSQQQSELSAYAEQLGDAMDEVVQIMAEWARIPVTGNVKVYNDFGVASIDAATEVLLLNAATERKISDETLFNELRRRGTISQDLDWQDEKLKIASQPKPETTQATPITE